MGQAGGFDAMKAEAIEGIGQQRPHRLAHRPLMGEAHAHQGAMSEAMGALLPYAFDRLGLHRVEAACLPHNTASRALLAKLGFREEGFAVRYLKINGSWQDHVLHSLLAEEYKRPT